MSPAADAVMARARQDDAALAPPAVRLSSVTRVFGVLPAVVRVDLTVERGEVVLVRGPNGAGRSTLLRLMATALSRTYGSGAVRGFELVAGRLESRRGTESTGQLMRGYGVVATAADC